MSVMVVLLHGLRFPRRDIKMSFWDEHAKTSNPRISSIFIAPLNDIKQCGWHAFLYGLSFSKREDKKTKEKDIVPMK